jgi:hypothetical protein
VCSSKFDRQTTPPSSWRGIDGSRVATGVPEFKDDSSICPSQDQQASRGPILSESAEFSHTLDRPEFLPDRSLSAHLKNQLFRKKLLFFLANGTGSA